jgi:hypothetical protein
MGTYRLLNWSPAPLLAPFWPAFAEPPPVDYTAVPLGGEPHNSL